MCGNFLIDNSVLGPGQQLHDCMPGAAIAYILLASTGWVGDLHSHIIPEATNVYYI